MCGITYQSQLGGYTNIKRYRNHIPVPLAGYNQLAIHYITWPVWKIVTGRCVLKNQPSILGPAGT